MQGIIYPPSLKTLFPKVGKRFSYAKIDIDTIYNVMAIRIILDFKVQEDRFEN